MSQLPAGYVQCVEQMFRSARSWLSVNDYRTLRFRLPPQDVQLVAELTAAASWLSATPAARRFLEFLDHETKLEATAFQACILVRELGLPFEEWPPEEVEALKQGKVMPQA